MQGPLPGAGRARTRWKLASSVLLTLRRRLTAHSCTLLRSALYTCAGAARVWARQAALLWAVGSVRGVRDGAPGTQALLLTSGAGCDQTARQPTVGRDRGRGRVSSTRIGSKATCSPVLMTYHVQVRGGTRNLGTGGGGRAGLGYTRASPKEPCPSRKSEPSSWWQMLMLSSSTMAAEGVAPARAAARARCPLALGRARRRARPAAGRGRPACGRHAVPRLASLAMFYFQKYRKKGLGLAILSHSIVPPNN